MNRVKQSLQINAAHVLARLDVSLCASVVFALLCSHLAVAQGTGQISRGQAGQPYTNRVLAVVEQIKGLPDWTHIGPEDTSTKKQLMQGLDRIAAEQTSVLRAAFEEVVSIHRQSPDLERRLMATLFLVNRRVFDVPARSRRQDAKSFGGWVGIPVSGETVDLLWPLATNKEQKFELVGQFQGYFGEVFAAVPEFDYFNARFGRRP